MAPVPPEIRHRHKRSPAYQGRAGRDRRWAVTNFGSYGKTCGAFARPCGPPGRAGDGRDHRARHQL